MKQIIKNRLKLLLHSFNDHTPGSSSRKLTAFVIVCLIIIIQLTWLWYAYITPDFSLIITILGLDIAFVSTLLGLTTYSKYIDKKREIN